MKIKEVIPVYLKHLKAIGRAERTVKGAWYDLRSFTRFLDAEGVYDLEDLSGDIMQEYQEDRHAEDEQDGDADAGECD